MFSLSLPFSYLHIKFMSYSIYKKQSQFEMRTQRNENLKCRLKAHVFCLNISQCFQQIRWVFLHQCNEMHYLALANKKRSSRIHMIIDLYFLYLNYTVGIFGFPFLCISLCFSGGMIFSPCIVNNLICIIICIICMEACRYS